MELPKIVKPMKKEDAAICCGRKGPKTIMEVVGTKGQKVSEYVDSGNDSSHESREPIIISLLRF